MVWLALLSLLGGVFCGMFVFSAEHVELLGIISEYALYILMFSVGMSIGTNKEIFSKLRSFGKIVLIIPAAITAASVLSGFLCAFLTGVSVRDSVCITSGLGWYSLTGVMLTDLSGATIGTMAFLSNLLREMISFFSIPLIAKHLNYYCAIAPAAATSEDTTLPMMIKYTSEEMTVVSVINGVLCSAAVPVLVNFFHAML